MEKINYTLTLEDCNNFTRSQIKIQRLRKYIFKNYFKLYLIFILGVLLISIFLFGLSVLDISMRHHITIISVIKNNGFPHFLTSQFKSYLSITMTFSVIFFILLPLKDYIWDGHYIYKMLKGMDLNYEISVFEENITRTNKNGVSIFNWATIKDIYDTKYNYLIFVSDLQAIIIPKRCFENEDQGKEFYNTIQKYYNAAQNK